MTLRVYREITENIHIIYNNNKENGYNTYIHSGGVYLEYRFFLPLCFFFFHKTFLFRNGVASKYNPHSHNSYSLSHRFNRYFFTDFFSFFPLDFLPFFFILLLVFIYMSVYMYVSENQ